MTVFSDIGLVMIKMKGYTVTCCVDLDFVSSMYHYCYPHIMSFSADIILREMNHPARGHYIKNRYGRAGHTFDKMWDLLPDKFYHLTLYQKGGISYADVDPYVIRHDQNSSFKLLPLEKRMMCEKNFIPFIYSIGY